MKVSASPQTLLQEISDHFVHIKRKIKVGEGRVISIKAVEKKLESRQWNMTRLLPLIVSFVARLPNFKLLPGHCVRTCNLLPQSVHSLLSEMNTCSQNSISWTQLIPPHPFDKEPQLIKPRCSKVRNMKFLMIKSYNMMFVIFSCT